MWEKNLKEWVNTKSKNDTIEITINASGILKPLITDKTINLKKDSLLLDLLNVMIRRYGSRFRKIVVDPETKEISASICIMRNGKTTNNFDEKLEHGDEITVFIFIAGG